MGPETHLCSAQKLDTERGDVKQDIPRLSWLAALASTAKRQQEDAALSWSRGGHDEMSSNKPVFAMWVLNEGGYPVSQCLLQAQQAGLQAADQKQTKKRRARAARHSRDAEIARQGH